MFDTYLFDWQSKLSDIVKNPILRTYRIIKQDFKMEPHLYHVQDTRYRNAITKLRTSSHELAIERVDI